MLPETDADLLALAQPAGPTPGARGLFRDDGWLRRVSGAPVAIFGGGRALLLEIAHPFVAAGVAEHSAYRSDPFGRLQRTLAAMQAITFGELPEALAAARGVERAHGRVRGTLPEAAGPFPAGTPYSGRDPEAVRWVWATLADTAWLLYERFVEPLDADAREAYYAEHRVLAVLVGVDPELVPDIARTVIDPPADAATARLARSITSGLLPRRLREAFGLPWDASREQRLAAMIEQVRALRKAAPAGA
jgi:uncharacterized protein (DUF2236 family)